MPRIHQAALRHVHRIRTFAKCSSSHFTISRIHPTSVLACTRPLPHAEISRSTSHTERQVRTRHQACPMLARERRSGCTKILSQRATRSTRWLSPTERRRQRYLAMTMALALKRRLLMAQCKMQHGRRLSTLKILDLYASHRQCEALVHPLRPPRRPRNSHVGQPDHFAEHAAS